MLSLLLLCAANPGWPPPSPDLEPAALARPEQQPDDPGYAPRETDEGCAGQLGLYSFTPACTGSIQDDPALGSGIHADRAWLLTTGRPEVTIGFVDGGVDLAHPDLVARFALNAGELPAPVTSTGAASPHDRNKDGAFTVLDYTTATGTVAPTPDRVVDRRLLMRADRGDVDGNGLLDPRDLIVIFGDGVDGDQNGYVDDIAGWDFVDDDNDPSGDGGTPLLLAAVATANDGVGIAGVCPRCTALPLRAGADRLGSSTAVALATAYAVDGGARAVATSLEIRDQSAFLAGAVGYAFQRDVPVVASVGLGASPVPASPLPPDQVLHVGAAGYDRADPREATTAVAPDRCTRYGPQLDVVAPGSPGGCDAAGPAGLVAGVVGLIRSAELGIPKQSVPPIGPPLGAGELMQLIVLTATPLAAPAGFGLRTGFGRVHARQALDGLIRRRIPVYGALTAPGWHEILDPTAEERLGVRGVVDNRRFDRATWQLDFAIGFEPDEKTFESLGSGTVEAGEVQMIAGAVPTAGLIPDPAAPPLDPAALAVTVRLRTSAAESDGPSSEIRRAFFVHRDLEILPAFPLHLGARATAPRISDLDGDGEAEILLATAQGSLHALSPRGTPHQGWPRRGPISALVEGHGAQAAFTSGPLDPDVREPILEAPSVAPAGASGFDYPVVVAVTAGGSLLALDNLGNPLPGFPVRVAPRPSAPVLYDLDGDGVLEVVLSSGTRLYAYGLDGAARPGFPVEVEELIGKPAAGNLDADPLPELVVAGTGRMYVFDGAGVLEEGWPVDVTSAIAGLGEGLERGLLPAPVLANLDEDEELEIVLAVRGGVPAAYDPSGMRTLEVRVGREEVAEGSDVSTLGAPLSASAGHPTVADVSGDGVLDLFLPARPEDQLQGLDPEHEPERMLAAWSLGAGGFVTGYPRRAQDPSPAPAAAADLDGDRRIEWITGGGTHRLFAWGVGGSNPSLWPKLLGGAVDVTPAVGDLDGDGLVEVVAVTSGGAVFVFRTGGRPAHVVWEGFGHDNRGTDNLATPLSVRAPLDPEEGCGCTGARKGARSIRGVWGVVAALLLLTRRRQGRGR